MRGLLAAVLLLAGAIPASAVRPARGAKAEARRFGLDKLERPMRRGPRAESKNEFARFNSRNEGRWKLRFDPRTGAPAALSEGRTAPRSGPPSDVARRFLQEQRALLGVDPDSLQVEKESKGDGHRHVMYRQLYRGLPVEFARVKVHMNADGSVIGANSTYEPDLNLPLTPSISAADAVRAAEADSRGAADGTPTLVVLPVQATGRSHLAWKVKVKAPQAAWRYYVDARTGQILFRYNNLRFAAGTITGMVYDIDPFTTPGPTARPFPNQWVYISNAGSRALTGSGGSYTSGTPGKVSMGLQGPFVNASNFRGASAHYDNGGGVWSSLASPVSSQHPYANSGNQTSTINLTVAAPTAVKFLPIFSAFNVGEFSGLDASDLAGGGIVDDDELTISDGNGDRIASYIGNRGSFHGAAVAGRVMNLTLKSNDSGQHDGYDVSLSSFLTVTAPGVAAAGESHAWSIADAPIGLQGELNLFYHLNVMHDYFFGDVNKSSAAPVSTPVVAMAHVGPNMSNAFYNPDFDNLMFGDIDNTAPLDGFTNDATVTHHEYVHYLVEKIWSIQNFGQAGAISEAIADYFSGSSLNDPAIGFGVLASLGINGSLRDIDCQVPGVTCKVLTNVTWLGEIHDDSIYLSQALWDIRRDRMAALGAAAGRSCADGLAFQALLYFPESFDEFYSAMRRVDREGGVPNCGAANTAQGAITSAFGAHGLIFGGGTNDEFDTVIQRNDGFETATDISTRPAISATIYPTGDADFYRFSAGPGLVDIKVNLPASGGYYKGYQLVLFDRSHREVARSAPPYDGTNTLDGLCETFDCNTSVGLLNIVYNNPSGGMLYAQVVGGDSINGSNSGVQSTTPYGISFVYPKAAALAGSIVTATFDNDVISFSVDVTTFISNQDWRYDSAQLRDHALAVIANTQVKNPAIPGNLLTFLTATNASGRVTGQVRVAPGFAARYPGAGTVHLEVFGYNVQGSTASLGLSNALNLTADTAELTAYNNVFNPARGEKTTIKYATLNSGRIVIQLFTVTGTFVKTLLDADMPAGKGSMDWDGRNITGNSVASGIYLLRIDGPGIHKTQKIAIIK